jgi:hypothetical protein
MLVSHPFSIINIAAPLLVFPLELEMILEARLTQYPGFAMVEC